MAPLKDIDFRILAELMKNSKTSDRKLAKILGVSQPTVTRRRAKLESELIDGYTVVPNWEKIGYKLLTITLIRTKSVFSSKEKYLEIRKRGMEWLKKQNNVLMGGACEGLGKNSFMISVHKTYGEYDKFIHKLRQEMADLLEDLQSVIVNLTATERIKPLHFKYLAQASDH